METDITQAMARLEEKLPLLITTKVAARLIGCGERTFWRWSRCGIAPRPIKIGDGRQGAVRFRWSEILVWIEAGCPRVDGGRGR